MAKAKKRKTYSALKGEVAYEALAAELAALDARALEPGRAQYADAARAVVAAMKLVAQPAIRARFDALPAAEFAHVELDRASALAEAMLYIRQKYESAAARSSAASVPAAFVDEAMQLKSRMLEVLDYVVGDLGGMAAELASIRSGAGYTDLTQDLARLSRLYQEHRKALAADRVKYAATDARRAAELNRVILESLRTDATAEWIDQSQRAWTLLRQAYDEVRAAALFLFRGEPERRALFPSLFAAGRADRAAPAAVRVPAGDAGSTVAAG